MLNCRRLTTPVTSCFDKMHNEEDDEIEFEFEEEEESAQPTNINGFSAEYFDEKNRKLQQYS